MYQVHYKSFGVEFVLPPTQDKNAARMDAIDLMCDGYGRIWIEEIKEEENNG